MKPLKISAPVADGALARILENNRFVHGHAMRGDLGDGVKANEWMPVEGLVFRGDHSATHDLATDRQGRSFSPAGAQAARLSMPIPILTGIRKQSSPATSRTFWRSSITPAPFVASSSRLRLQRWAISARRSRTRCGRRSSRSSLTTSRRFPTTRSPATSSRFRPDGEGSPSHKRSRSEDAVRLCCRDARSG
jgi:hypothetical protein